MQGQLPGSPILNDRPQSVVTDLTSNGGGDPDFTNLQVSNTQSNFTQGGQQ